MNEYCVEMIDIKKEFNGVLANDSITLKLIKGNVHALLGENGAGKSTLMSILFGLYQKDSGIIKINGTEQTILNPKDATNYGIGMVHQHFKLVEDFTVLENIILGNESTKLGFLDYSEAKLKVLNIIKDYGLNVSLDEKVENISVGMQQKVEILKMLYKDNEILIFDEPTAVLTPQEITDLLNIIKKFQQNGKTILFISHKLDEIMKIADDITVLRKGKKIATLKKSETSKEALSELMVGKKIPKNIKLKEIDESSKNVALKIENLTLKKAHSNRLTLDNINFELKKYEILAIIGIEGNGQTDLVRIITGLDREKEKSIYFNNMLISKKSIRERNLLKIAHIPEDRHRYGLILDYTLAYNLILKKYFLKEFKKLGFLNNKAINNFADELINIYDIRCNNGINTIARSMSGGNQQKAIIARELTENPELLIAVQPTRGLDIGAISNIHNKIINIRNEGAAVLLVTLEIDEALEISDRILVMFNGKIVKELDPKKTNRKEIGFYMAGGYDEKD